MRGSCSEGPGVMSISPCPPGNNPATRQTLTGRQPTPLEARDKPASQWEM